MFGVPLLVLVGSALLLTAASVALVLTWEAPSPTSCAVVDVGGNNTRMNGGTPSSASFLTRHLQALFPANPCSNDDNVTEVTYRPGVLDVPLHGMILSQGLTARILARSGEPVTYHDGSQSVVPFHANPDGGDTFVDTRPGNKGGWVFASNSEVEQRGGGGVGAMTFDKNGNVIDYRMVLEGSHANCNGGRTPWSAWISSEEDFKKRQGIVWQTDPMGIRPAQNITLGAHGGQWEAFAFDIRDIGTPYFFLTEDAKDGALQRFTPYNPDWDDPWSILLGPGDIHSLVLIPDPLDVNRGTFAWTTDYDLAKANAALYYPETEGVDILGSTMIFVCKAIFQLFKLNLDEGSYQRYPIGQSGLFDGEPDQIRHIRQPKPTTSPSSADAANNQKIMMAESSQDGNGPVPIDDVLDEYDNNTLFYFTEDGGQYAGLHVATVGGEVLTILEGLDYQPETAGLSFSPDNKRLYFAFQHDGVLVEVARLDGLAFPAKATNVEYHASNWGG